MKKILLILFIGSFHFLANAQESNNGKQLWAKSILNEKAPELIVEEWLSDKPETKGKFVLVDFWATWCGPCVAVIPKLNDMQKKYGEKLVVVGLSDEPAEKVKSFEKAKIEYFSAIDTKKTLNNALEVKGIPHMILIDPNGIVRWEGFPSLKDHQFDEEVLKGLLEKYGEKEQDVEVAKKEVKKANKKKS